MDIKVHTYTEHVTHKIRYISLMQCTEVVLSTRMAFKNIDQHLLLQTFMVLKQALGQKEMHVNFEKWI